jgi:hypothetical protein
LSHGMLILRIYALKKVAIESVSFLQSGDTGLLLLLLLLLLLPLCLGLASCLPAAPSLVRLLAWHKRPAAAEGRENANERATAKKDGIRQYLMIMK